MFRNLQEKKMGNTTKKSETGPEEKNKYFSELESLEVIDDKERLKRVDAVFRDKAAAAETIPLLYLKDVTEIAKLYDGQGVQLEDLIGEGNIALLMGAQSLDFCEDAREVEMFLTHTVMDAMEKLVADQNKESDIDSRIAEQVNRVYDAAKELSEALLRKVSIEELAAEMEEEVSVIEEAIRLSGNRIDFIQTTE